MKRRALLLAGALVLGVSCRAPQRNPDPEVNFEAFWRHFDRTYGQFLNKNVDWDSLYAVYRPRVTPATSADELFDVMVAMLAPLDDGHVWLLSDKRQFCASARWGIPREKDFSLAIVRGSYLRGGSSELLDGALIAGWLSGDIAYLYLRDFQFEESVVDSVLDVVLNRFGRALAMVLDVRDNPGGTGHVANRVADHFADRKRHFMSSKLRYGPEPENTLPMYFHVQPRGVTFRKPVILLTNRGTASAAERFTLALRVLPHVTLVGDSTAGLFSVKYRVMIPNGWRMDIAYKMSMDPLGRCWDAIGVPPDVFRRNTEADLEQSVDNVLDEALTLLQRGPPPLRDHPESLRQVRTSLVEVYFDTLAARGVDAAAAAVDRVRQGDPDTWFLDMKHCLRIADPYVFDGRAAQVIPILKVAMELYPQVAMTYDLLSAAYINSGDTESAREIIQRGENVPRMYPWEGKLFEDVKAALSI